jgi:hypothetical protein
MRACEVECGADRHDARRVDVVVRDVVVLLDVIEVHRLGDAGLLVEIADMKCGSGSSDRKMEDRKRRHPGFARKRVAEIWACGGYKVG